MYPDLFNLYSETFRRNLEEIPGLKVNGEKLSNIWYADIWLVGSQNEYFLDF